MVSQHLVEQWRTRLADWQRRLDEDRPRPWLARAYVRVLSFLLAQYGTAGAGRAETAQADTVKDSEAADGSSRMKFSVRVAELAGKPPKSGTQIRSVLEAVQANVPHPAEGPRIAGALPGDPIVVAAFYNLREVGRLVRTLEAEGIEWRTQSFRRQLQVVVRMSDLDRAKPIVARHAVDAHDSKASAASGARIGFRVGLCLTIVLLPLLVAFMIASGSSRRAVGAAGLMALFVITMLAACGYHLGQLRGAIISRQGRYIRSRKSDHSDRSNNQ